VRGSLRRLRTDYLDAVLLHWPTRAVPLATTLGAFARLAAQGVIRCFGVSNFDVPWLEAAEAALPPGARVALHQVSYSLCDRRPEARVLPFAAARGQVVMAYSPLCRGRLPAGGGALEEVARARGVSPATVALAFLVSRPGVVAIPKAVRPEHVRANAAAGDLVLTPEELARLEAAFPRGDRTALDTLPTSGWFFRLAWATIRVWHGLVR
jgi:aryl-alcohol dehydrogenase-like predicted oxidoreductase